MQGSIRALVGSTLNLVLQKRVSKTLRNVAPVVNEARVIDLLDRTKPISHGILCKYGILYKYGILCKYGMWEQVRTNHGLKTTFQSTENNVPK